MSNSEQAPPPAAPTATDTPGSETSPSGSEPREDASTAPGPPTPPPSEAAPPGGWQRSETAAPQPAAPMPAAPQPATPQPMPSAFDAPSPGAFDAPLPEASPFDAPPAAGESPASAWSAPEAFASSPGDTPDDGRADLLPGLDDITSSVGPLEMQPPEPIGLTSGAMPAVEEEDAELAGFGLRLLAYLLDAVLFGGLALATFLVTQDHLIAGAVNLAGVLVITVCWALAGTSPGKRALGLVIVDAEGESRLGFACALKRAFGYLLSALPLGAGFVMVALGQDKRGLHDKIAGTWVYRT